MIRRFNYTERKRIARSQVSVRVAQEGGDRRFDAEFRLDDLRLPPEASLFVEAYHRLAYRRFDFGSVSDPRPPADRSLAGIGVGKPLFRVKVVAREGEFARILAAAERLIPEDSDRQPDAREPLLPVEFADLGERVWRLDLDSEGPRLWLNNRIEGVREAARSGSSLPALVYPEIFRAILVQAFADDSPDPDCDDDRWETLWARFACRELGRPNPRNASKAAQDDWIDGAVDAFCARMQSRQRLERLILEAGG